jgi:hypothetical protein
MAILVAGLDQNCNPAKLENICSQSRPNTRSNSRKLLPQTCTETCVDNDVTMDENNDTLEASNDSKIVDLSGSGHDSGLFQFEKRIVHTCVVPDTAPTDFDVLGNCSDDERPQNTSSDRKLRTRASESSQKSKNIVIES